MKRNQIDAALIGLCGLVTAAGILSSAAGIGKIGVVLLAVALSAAIIITGSLLIGYRRRTQRAVLPAVTVTVICLAVIISVAATHWPLRINYALARDSFEALARRIRTGEQITTPVHVGLFTIRRAEISRNGIVCLWTHPQPNGSTGFVRCQRDYLPFNLWSMVRLDDRWQFISED